MPFATRGMNFRANHSDRYKSCLRFGDGDPPCQVGAAITAVRIPIALRLSVGVYRLRERLEEALVLLGQYDRDPQVARHAVVVHRPHDHAPTQEPLIHFAPQQR